MKVVNEFKKLSRFALEVKADTATVNGCHKNIWLNFF